MRADLHVHTAVSDCSMMAEAIIAEAKTRGITHLAFTDHDTTECAWENESLAEEAGLLQ